MFNFVKHRSHLLLSINSLIQFVLDLYQLISRLKERVFVRIVSAVFYTQETRCIHACTSQLVPACAVIAPRRGAKRNISDAIRANKKLAARDSPPPARAVTSAHPTLRTEKSLVYELRLVAPKDVWTLNHTLNG